ncbi:hypothetical protein [Herbidospora mongoliensis]|uniref:hypothetical protein n=1 Tax=Herbidospora mongoliensis TaxID=688067 RepID=UPI001C3F1A82|nr:hypothetical protein [Herbidospora mongoliensis]
MGEGTDRIAYGNETNFADLPISELVTLKYWVFAGTNSMAGVSLPAINIEADPNVGLVNETTLIYMPDVSVSPSAPVVRVPNVWQQYDASATGSRWYASGATGVLINCTAVSPCSFDELKTRLPDAVITYSLGFNSDNSFIGAIDGLQVNNTVYDFESFGVRKRLLTP